MAGLARGGLKLWLAGVLFMTPFAQAEPLRIVGSSALFPFIVATAERFGYEMDTDTPVVESTGTGGGIKFFCSGTTKAYPDMVTASRPMTPLEKAYCARHGVHGVTEIALGLDALVVARAREGLFFPLTVAQLRAAVQEASHLPTKWQEVSPTFPYEQIKVFLPPETAGTRETFEHLVLSKRGKCRKDGAVRSVADQEGVIARKLSLAPEAMGVLSYAFLIKNHDTLKAFHINGVSPTKHTITSGTYPLVRHVFLYVKTRALQDKEQVRAFVHYITSKQMEELLSSYGLLPLSPREAAFRQTHLQSAETPRKEKGAP
jgi:phosphate transport system substrate-binding protein